jgi:type IV fimbrial biogenesis protein FimT
MRKKSEARGFSLYELMLTITLVALLLGLAIPSFGSIVANHRLKVEVNALFHAVHLARKGSIVRRRVITICPSHNGSDCQAGLDWSAGWIMFVNTDRDSPAVRDPDEPILQHHPVDQNARIMSNRNSYTLRSTELRATNGTLVFCDRRGRTTARALVISYTGRPRVARTDRRGQPYRCPD